MENNAGNSREITDITELEDFKGWDQFASEEDFFAKAGEDTADTSSTKAKNVIQQASEEDDEGDDPDKSKTSATKEQDFFAVAAKEENEIDQGDAVNTATGDNDEEDEEQEQVGTTIGTLNFLKEKGLVDFELEDGQELTEELAEELIEDKFEENVESTVKELMKDLPLEVQQLNQYILKGGNFSTFIASVAKAGSPAISGNLDLEQEGDQETVVRETLKDEGYDNEYIEAQTKFLKDSGMLKSTSEKMYGKKKKKEEAIQAQLVQQQEDAKIAQKEALKKAKQSVTTYLSDNTEIGALTVNREDKKQLPSYMNDKNVKLQNGAVITELEKDLFYDLRQNEEAYMQLALLMRNRNEDGTFNFESIVKDAKTKVAKEVKDNVRRSKNGTPNKSKGTKPKRNLSLAEIFND